MAKEKSTYNDPFELSEERKELFMDFEKELLKSYGEAFLQKAKEEPQNIEKLRAEYRNRFLTTRSKLKKLYAIGDLSITKNWVDPGISATIPAGFGGLFGTVSFSSSFTARSKFGGGKDGSIGLTVGLGNPFKYVGFSLSVVAESLYSDEEPPEALADYFKLRLNNGGVNLRMTRVLPYNMGFAYGFDHLLSWGIDSDIISNFKRAQYLVLSKIFPNLSSNQFFSRLALNIGLGTKAYLPIEKYLAVEGGVWPFAGANIRIANPVSFSVETIAKEVNLGLHIAPFSETRLVGQFLANNILGREGYKREFILSGAYTYIF